MTSYTFSNKIVQGDALEIMEKLPTGSVDLAFADPPFNLNKKYNGYHDNKSTEQYLGWCYQWLDEMLRVLKPTGTLFVHNVPKWLAYYAAYLNERACFKHWIAWDAMGPPLGKTLLPTHYGILYYVKSPKGFKFYDVRAPHKVCRECGAFAKDYGGKKDQMHPFGTLLSDVWTDIHRIRHKKRRDEHPCQLPLPLLERLILMTTDEGDLVLDPFVGTGTTAIAAKKLGRNYLGIDIDPQYVALARRKVGRALPTKINDSYVSLYLGKVLTIRDKDYKKLEVHLSQTRHNDEYRRVELPETHALLLKYH